MMPAKMTLGSFLSVTASSSIQIQQGYSETTQHEVSFQLIAIGEHEWKGKMYPSITLKDELNDEIVYLKGVGQLSIGSGIELESLKIDSLDNSDNSIIEETLTKAGSGSLSWIFLFLMSSLLWLRKKPA